MELSILLIYIIIVSKKFSPSNSLSSEKVSQHVQELVGFEKIWQQTFN
jgi:hypothetical protein